MDIFTNRYVLGVQIVTIRLSSPISILLLLITLPHGEQRWSIKGYQEL